MDNRKAVATSMGFGIYVDQDESGVSIYITKYRDMIGSLLYLTKIHPEIMFNVCLCARFQENLKELHLASMKRIMNYLKRIINVDLWYSKGSLCDLIGYSDHIMQVVKLTKKSQVVHGPAKSKHVWLLVQLRPNILQ